MSGPENRSQDGPHPSAPRTAGRSIAPSSGGTAGSSFEGASGGGRAGPGPDLSGSFGIDKAEFDAMWARSSARVEASFETHQSSSSHRETHHREHFESRLLEDYTTRLKALALQVAHLELMVSTYTKSFEARFAASFQHWSDHFDARLDSTIDAKLRVGIRNEVNTYVSNDAELRARIVQQVRGDIEGAVVRIVDKRVLKLKQELLVRLNQEIDTSIDVHLDAKIALLKATLVAQITQEVTQIIQVRVDAAITDIDIDVDIASIRFELNRVLQQILHVENKVVIDIDTKLTDLREWILVQFLQIKGCLTDRHVLTETLAEFSAELRVRLEEQICVSPEVWAGSSPPTPPGYTTDGLLGTIYSLSAAGVGLWDDWETVIRSRPVGTVVVGDQEQIGCTFGTDEAEPPLRTYEGSPVQTSFGIRFSGQIEAPTPGKYALRVRSPGHVRMTLDDMRVGPNAEPGAGLTESFNLAGRHSLKIDIQGADRSEGRMTLEWKPPGKRRWSVVPTSAVWRA